MSFSFIWFKKRNSKVIKSEFLTFLRKNRFSYIRFKFHKYRKFKKYLRLKNFYFFNFSFLGVVKRFPYKKKLNFNFFFNVFFWVRFMSHFINIKSNLFLFNKLNNNTLMNNSPSSLLFIPLTKQNLLLPRLYRVMLRRRRIAKVLLKNRKVQVKFYLFNYALLIFFFKSFLNQIGYLKNLNFLNDYYKLLNIIIKNFVKY